MCHRDERWRRHPWRLQEQKGCTHGLLHCSCQILSTPSGTRWAGQWGRDPSTAARKRICHPSNTSAVCLLSHSPHPITPRFTGVPALTFPTVRFFTTYSNFYPKKSTNESVAGQLRRTILGTCVQWGEKNDFIEAPFRFGGKTFRGMKQRRSELHPRPSC